MYENHTEVVKIAEDEARATSMRDRQRYAPFLARAESIAAENDMIVGGPGATEYLLAAAPGLESFTLELLTANAARDAKQLAIALFEVDPDGLGHYTTMITRNPDEEYVIVVDGRELVRVRGIPMHERKGIRLTKMIAPSACNARFGVGDEKTTLRCLGPDVQLIATYTTLCDPSRASQWLEAAAAERALRALFAKEFATKIPILAGADDPKAWRERRAALFAELWRVLAAGNRVAVGRNAVRLLSGEAAETTGVMQFVSGNRLRADIEEVKRLAAQHRFAVRYFEDDPLVPGDPRLRRTTIALEGHPGGRKDNIVQLYNAAEYDLVPFIDVGRVKAGSPYAIMRFRLVDMWIVRLLGNIDAISGEQVRALLGELVGEFDAAAGLLAAEPDRVFPLTYVGRLENAEIAQKRAAHMARKPFVQPFYPVADRHQKRSPPPKKEVTLEVLAGKPAPANPSGKPTYAQIAARDHKR
ncbi:MAG: hypothetical protein KGL39_01620 [Patescibacteria group bacterium]|nr:hypothetical protein [Patescibacteria group bacterium]